MSTHRDDFDELDLFVLQARDSVIAKLDAATDFGAVLADIYAKAAKDGTPEAAAAAPTRSSPHQPQTALDDVCDHIDMLTTLLKAVSGPGVKDSPLIGAIYLSSAWRSLQRLRRDLARHRIGKGEALRLIGNAEHNLREADAALRSEHGLSLDDALRGRIGDLMELGSDITGQVQVLRAKVARLFDNAAEAASLTPVPQA
jgi:hypothetical protein